MIMYNNLHLVKEKNNHGVFSSVYRGLTVASHNIGTGGFVSLQRGVQIDSFTQMSFLGKQK